MISIGRRIFGNFFATRQVCIVIHDFELAVKQIIMT